jgi:hypothetical protein
MTLAILVMLVFGVVLLAALVSAAMFVAAPKNWRVIGVPADNGQEYAVGGTYPTENVAVFAAKRRLRELAQLQAATPTQDQVWIVRPNGERYRVEINSDSSGSS